MNIDGLSGIYAKKKPFLIIAVVLFCISFFFWILKWPGTRYVLFFQASDSSRLCMEARYLHFHSGQSHISAFVDELLLGPETERFRPLFSPGTRAGFCFVRKGVLYVNLSPELLQEAGGASAIREGTVLFRRNILENFRNIKKIEMFADGKRMYENG